MAEADSIGCGDWRSKPRKFNVDPEWLRTEYADKMRPTGEIAAEIGCTQEHLNNLIKKFGIPRRDGRAGRILPSKRASFDIERAKWMYLIERMNCDDIGAKLGVHGTTVRRKMKEAGVEIRHHNDTKRGVRHSRRIESRIAAFYISEAVTLEEVASKFGVGLQTVSRVIKDRGLPMWTASDLGVFKGENNPNWREDLTPEERASRRDQFMQAKWRASIFERDGFVCQRCGDHRGGNLHAHHIEAHCENRESRWDVDNGITLCSPCHREFHRQYGLKGFGRVQLAQYLA